METPPDENSQSADRGGPEIATGVSLTPVWNPQTTSQRPEQVSGLSGSNLSLLPILNKSEVSERKRLGYFLLFLSIFAIFVTSCNSLNHIDNVKPLKRQPSALDYVKLSVRGSITVAFIFFCYGMMHAGERLLIPDKWIRTSDDLKLVLGNKPTQKMASDDVKSFLDLLKKLTNRREE